MQTDAETTRRHDPYNSTSDMTVTVTRRPDERATADIDNKMMATDGQKNERRPTATVPETTSDGLNTTMADNDDLVRQRVCTEAAREH